MAFRVSSNFVRGIQNRHTMKIGQIALYHINMCNFVCSLWSLGLVCLTKVNSSGQICQDKILWSFAAHWEHCLHQTFCLSQMKPNRKSAKLKSNKDNFAYTKNDTNFGFTLRSQTFLQDIEKRNIMEIRRFYHKTKPQTFLSISWRRKYMPLQSQCTSYSNIIMLKTLCTYS